MRHTTNQLTSIESNRVGLRLLVILLAGVLMMGPVFVNGFAQQEVEPLNRFVQTQNAVAARIFREGRDSIGDEKWQEAEGKFRSFVANYPKEKNLDAALYWLAFALSKQEKFAQASAQLQRLVNDFPKSNWADDASALRVQIAPHLGDQRVIDDTLNKDDVEVKIVALESLFSSSPERGLAYVAEMMKPGSKANSRLKEAGIEMLRRYGGKQASALLLDVVRNQTDRELRAAAIHALGRAGDESVLPLLKDLAVNSTDEEISEAAVFAISRFDSEAARALLLELARGGKTVEARKHAIFWLSQNGDAAMDELMRIYASETDEEVKKQIIFALKRMGTPRSLAKLYEIARNTGDAAEVRKNALHWISQSGDKQALDFLIQMYDTEKDEDIRQQIIFALSRVGDKRAIQKMIDIAKRDSSVELRKQAIFWLGRTNDPEAQKFLEDLLK